MRAKSSDVHFGHLCYKNCSKSALEKVPQDTIKIEEDPWQGNLVDCQLLGTLDLEVLVELHGRTIIRVVVIQMTPSVDVGNC